MTGFQGVSLSSKDKFDKFSRDESREFCWALEGLLFVCLLVLVLVWFFVSHNRKKGEVLQKMVEDYGLGIFCGGI